MNELGMNWRAMCRRAMLGLAAVSLLAAACSGNDDDAGLAPSANSRLVAPDSYGISDDSMDGDYVEDMAQAAPTAGVAESGSALTARQASGSDASGTDAVLTQISTTADPDINAGRDIIYTAFLSVEAADVEAASIEATAIVTGVGGIVFGRQTNNVGQPRTTFTFKVRPEHFNTALDRLSDVGEMLENNISSADVTERVVDLNSRIVTAEASVERLREFLTNATDVDGVAELERELSQREENLERLRGQLRVLRDQVDLSTITMIITEAVEATPDRSATLAVWLAAGDDDPCLGFFDLVVPANGPVSLCIEIENVGETTLTELDVSGAGLRFRNSDLTVTDNGDFSRLEPGDRLTATLTEQVTDGRIGNRVATRGLEIGVSLSAVPVNENGETFPPIVRARSAFLTAMEDDSPPGFTDALSGGWDALVGIGNVILLVLGALVPFAPVAVIALVLAWLWLRRRRARQPSG